MAKTRKPAKKSPKKRATKRSGKRKTIMRHSREG